MEEGFTALKEKLESVLAVTDQLRKLIVECLVLGFGKLVVP